LARYRDTTKDLVEDLLESKFAIIPRKQNLQAHCLATFASTCNPPFSPIQKYTAEIKHRPIVPDNSFPDKSEDPVVTPPQWT